MKNNKEFSFENPCNNVCMDIRRVKLISQPEWERLKSHLDMDSIEAAKIEEKKAQIEKIKAQSKEMVKNWTNTFLGARQKKLEDRANRIAEEEKAKLAIDREEEKFQAEQRKKAIEKAKLQLYYETDRVRNLHSGLNLTETLKERDMQLEFKHLKSKLDAKKEKVYVENMKKSIEAAIKKEQEEAEKKREKNIQIAQELKAQINEHEEEKERQRAQLLAEGEELRRIAIADHLERQKLEQIYRDQMRKLTSEFHDQINGHKQMKEIEKLQDEEIEEKCRLFAAAKIKMTKMRIMKEREIFKQKEAELQKIQEYLSEKLKSAHDNEEARLNRATAEKEEKYQLDEKEKLEKQAKIIREINEHRLQEIDRHRKELEKEKEAEYNEVRERIAAELAVAEYENACKAKRLEEIKGLSRQLLQESIDKRENVKEERKKEIEMAGNENKLIQIEENIFQDYANRVINHCRANGRNVYPLEKAARTGAMTGLGTGLPGKPSLVKVDVNQLNNTQTDDDLTNTEFNLIDHISNHRKDIFITVDVNYAKGD
ncbi:unnamed protein product [Trichobilharzia szidati]|nr:unnamed protein product [Trichobilharzia szidati]